ncbi:hypothetical protein ACFC6U_27875 [Kitasatospora purpeofusca]|uniref:hypothetical protein n=1 Tax=Kitasatospora purpeofusca TaxID=67352 RepID=UPI0035DAEB9A
MQAEPDSIHPSRTGSAEVRDAAGAPYPAAFLDLPLSELLRRLARAEQRAERAEVGAVRAWEQALGRPSLEAARELNARLRRVRIALETPGRDSVPAAELQEALYGELDNAPRECGPAPADG